MDFSTPTVDGKAASVNVCWNWVSNGQGAYDGRVWGKFYNPYTDNGKIYLQARAEPDRWVSFVSAGTEVANGKSFNKPFHEHQVSRIQGMPHRTWLPLVLRLVSPAPTALGCAMATCGHLGYSVD
ncbi:hypothetical protein [Nocardia fluminea]|uniref:hypothetical protein n=1 Tax=Nocardia fluminea TaxID=134984 RepID=UPI00340CB892